LPSLDLIWPAIIVAQIIMVTNIHGCQNLLSHFIDQTIIILGVLHCDKRHQRNLFVERKFGLVELIGLDHWPGQELPASVLASALALHRQAPLPHYFLFLPYQEHEIGLDCWSDYDFQYLLNFPIGRWASHGHILVGCHSR